MTGDIDMATADGVAAMASAAIDEGACHLVLDLQGVTFMDSQGLRALVLAQRALADAGGSLTLTGIPPRVDKLLDIAGLRSTFGLA